MRFNSAFALTALAASLVALPSAGAAQDSARGPEHGRHGAHAGPGRGHGHGGARMQGARSGGPAERLLAQRSELGLSNDQVKRLEAIRTKYEARNRPLVEKLRATHGDRARMRSSMRSSMRDSVRGPRDTTLSREQREARMKERREQRLAANPELKSTMEALHKNRDEASKEAMAVLTSDQRERVEKRMEQRRERMKERMERQKERRGERATERSGS
jgi:hypothetical protein